MKTEKILKKFHLDEKKMEEIKNAVASAETKTSAEISLALSSSSCDYSFWELVFAFICGIISFCIMIPLTSKINSFIDSSFWIVRDWYLPAFMVLVFSLVVGIVFCFANIPFIDRLVVNKRIRSKFVYNKALRLFVQSGVYNTKKHNGVLIYFSVLEKQVQIIADVGTVNIIPTEVWTDMANKLASGFGSGNPYQTIIDSIHECSEILSKSFPCEEENPNELPDGLVIVEGGE